MQIQNTYELDIFIDELSLFKAPGTAFICADIYEAIMNPIPICELKLIIPKEWLDNRTITDGTKISIKIESKILKITKTFEFRLFNIRELRSEQNLLHVSLECVLDFMDGYGHANEHNLYGASSDVFKQIATQYGIKNDIDQTNDQQLWVAGQNNIYQFFNEVCKYGWINETSAMFWCLDKEKNLLYKNLTTLFRNRQNNIWTFSQIPFPDLDKKYYCYSKSGMSIQSGTNNLRNEGYGGEDVYFDFPSYSWKKATSKKVVAESKLINISKRLSKGLAQDWYAFDIGNFHKNYYTASKQNIRILSTYSSYITLETQFFQGFRLGQIVNYEALDSSNPDEKLYSLSGTFMIDAIHTEIKQSAITCALELVMQGLNGKPTTQEVY